jgi:cobalt-zinc-cadmium efflux system outer membrane protein
MRARSCWLCALLFGFSFKTAAAQEVHEREAIQKFLATSPLLRVEQARVDVTRAEWRAGTLLQNPNVAASIEDAANTRDQYLLFQQVLPINGRLSLLRKAGKGAIGAAQARSERRRQLAVADFRRVFLALGAAQQREAILRQNVERLTELLRILREREKAGEGPGFDVMRAERELIDAQAEARLATVTVDQARARLAGFVPDLAAATVSTAIETDEALPGTDQALRQALEQRPDYRATHSELEQAVAQQRAAERLKMPDPTFNGGLKHSTISGFSGSGFVAGFIIPLPLFNHGQADVSRFRAEQQRLTGEQLLLQRQIEAEVRSAYAAASASADLLRTYQPPATAELLRAAETAYQEGERGILELLDAYRLVSQAELRRLDLSKTAKEARIEFDLAIGAEVQP